MEIKYSISPFELKTLTTEQIRDRILIKTVFAPDEAVLTYSFDERFILGGIMPVRNEIRLEPQDEIRQEYFLQTREMGVINIGGKGKIVELQGIMGTNVAQQRSEGFNSVIAENPDMEIVACQVADFDRAKAMSVMENILQANPEIDGLYAANDEMLLGALEAMDAAGRTADIVKVGCDAIDDTLEAIKDKRVEATIAEPPFFLGKAILNTAYDYLEGKEVEAHVVLDNQLVTQDTVDSLVTKE